MIMDAPFWHNKWEEKNTPFHQEKVNPSLVKYFNELSLPKDARVFVPLCGRTLDISSLLYKGFHVVGSELSPIAVEQLFVDIKVEPTITVVGNLKRYSGDNIDIYLGDIFDLTKSILGPVDATYDRAALVALPKDVRDRYTAHLIEVTNKAPQLLIIYEYDQNLLQGPPFSITPQEVHQHYEDNYDLTCLENINVEGGLKGTCPAYENVWLLQNK